MNNRLAIHGGKPVRPSTLPYGHQSIDAGDLHAVAEVLQSDWLTTGPKVVEFERAFAAAVGASEAVAVSSGTAALHAAMHALHIGPGDEVLVPAMTFAASANCVVYQGATPVFCDVDPETLLIDAAEVERKITARTRAIIAVDYAGQPCDYQALRQLGRHYRLPLVADACHSVGGRYHGESVGTLADLNIFSLHPVKALTTAEGGMITCADGDRAQTMRRFRNHGIGSDHFQREKVGSWQYDMIELGYNYRLSDVQCALGLSQLTKLPEWVKRRRQIARRYDAALRAMPALTPLKVMAGIEHAYHLYVVRLCPEFLAAGRAEIFAALRGEGIGVNVHYLPVHLHSFYRERLRTHPGICPMAEAAYENILSLPMFPAMADADVEQVIEALEKVLSYYERRIAAAAGAR